MELMLVQGDWLGATVSASSQVSRGRQNTVKPARTAAERFGIVTMAKKKKKKS